MGETQPSARQPLAGIRVVELSTMVTCSLASMIIRSQGAEVIKIEPIQVGDPMRLLGSQNNGISALFHNCNRGKRSLAIDIKHDLGREAVHRLARQSDVFLNNYRPGVMDKLGLGSQALRALNPQLINVAVTGFGTVGPLAHRPAYDHVIQGISGMTALQGGDSEFAFIRMLICDKVTAYTVAQAATAALVGRASTGQGQHIDISMLHACLAFMWPDGMMHHTLEDGIDLPPMSDYYQTVNGKDGSVASAPLLDQHWDAILSLLNRDDLREDSRFNTMAGRIAHMGEVMAILRDGARHLSTDAIMDAFEQADIPSTICENRDTLRENEQIAAIGALETYMTENMGCLTAPTPPVLFDGAPSSLAEPSPKLGAHSRDILQELAFDAASIDRLISEQAVLCA